MRLGGAILNALHTRRLHLRRRCRSGCCSCCCSCCTHCGSDHCCCCCCRPPNDLSSETSARATSARCAGGWCWRRRGDPAGCSSPTAQEGQPSVGQPPSVTSSRSIHRAAHQHSPLVLPSSTRHVLSAVCPVGCTRVQTESCVPAKLRIPLSTSNNNNNNNYTQPETARLGLDSAIRGLPWPLAP